MAISVASKFTSNFYINKKDAVKRIPLTASFLKPFTQFPFYTFLVLLFYTIIFTFSEKESPFTQTIYPFYYRAIPKSPNLGIAIPHYFFPKRTVFFFFLCNVVSCLNYYITFLYCQPIFVTFFDKKTIFIHRNVNGTGNFTKP